MRNLLEELENNEGILLMYLAGELPPEDRAEVEQMLRADAGLRRELERLRADYDRSMGLLEELDEASPQPGTAPLQKVNRLIRQWHVTRAARPAEVAVQPARYLRWAYPAAVAAALVLGLLIWQPWSTQQMAVVPVTPTRQPAQEVATETADERLDRAEVQLAALTEVSQQVPSFFAEPESSVTP